MESCFQKYFSVYAPEHFPDQNWKRCFGEKCVLVLFGALLGNVNPENWGRFWARKGDHYRAGKASVCGSAEAWIHMERKSLMGNLRMVMKCQGQ